MRSGRSFLRATLRTSPRVPDSAATNLVPEFEEARERLRRFVGPDDGRTTVFFGQATNLRQSLRPAWELSRSFQNWSRRWLAWMQRSARTFSAPDSPQNMPDCLQREPITVLQPASMTPEPIKRPWRRKAPYCIRSTL